MRVELLHFEGYPGSTEALSILEEVLAEEGISAEIELVAVSLGSQLDPPEGPTILVDGEGLFPVEEYPGACAASYRIYATH